MKNGTFMILGWDDAGHSKKVIDLKITNAFPILALDNNTQITTASGLIENKSYQHLSIPPDLAIHLTSGGETKTRLFGGDMSLESDIRDFKRIITYVSRPISKYTHPQGRWDGAVLISPHTDKDYKFHETRIVIDFFLSRSHEVSDLVQKDSDFFSGTRRAFDNTGCLFGPILDQAFQRKPKQAKFFLFLRYGYLNSPETHEDITYLDLPCFE